ncbi:UvrD-helicase domain-containing protein [Clostridium sp. CM028]|uniref:UvrD-helicase domain-containing protein n=1 Tax=Clostridium sp. CM028 TaxID=2851575 RepID=UPI00350E8E07
MKYAEVYNKINGNNFIHRCILVKGKSASGKTTMAVSKYKNMIENENIKSSNILCLFMNKYQNITWTREMDFNMTSEIRKNSYYGFIRKELSLYWPYVVENCKELKISLLKPEFASFDATNYAMKALVEHFRTSKGYFIDITSTSSKIASDLISNINNAALSLVPFNKIGTRLYNSLEVKDFCAKETYNQLDEVIQYYISKLLGNGVVDYGLCFYLYNKYLLKDARYFNMNKIKYLIVDDIDQASPSELDLIFKLIDNVDKAYLFYNPSGGFCSYYGANTNYLRQKLNIDYDEIILDEHFCCNDEFIDFSRAIENRAHNNYEEEKISDNLPAYIDLTSQLRCEMVEKISFKIEELINHGVKPKDIAVICPFNDFVISHELQKKTKELGISVMETSKKYRFIDNEYLQPLIILAVLCNSFTSIKLTSEDYKNFFSFMLQLDIIRSSLLSDLVNSSGEMRDINKAIQDRVGIEVASNYNELKKWISDYKESNLECNIPLGEFFRKAFLEVLITIPKVKQHVGDYISIYENCESFVNTLDKLQFKGKSSEERFIEFIRRDGKDFYSLNDIQEMLLQENSIVFTSPYTYLTSNLSSVVQIWADINSNMWCSRNIKELSNYYVLRSNWNINDIYTQETENNNIYRILMSVVDGLLRKCRGKLYIYGSEYSLNGYEQQSIFADILVEILSGRGENYDRGYE